MPINKHGDYYDEDDYGGDPSMGGRMETNQQSKEEKGQDFMEDVFVPNVLPIYFPGTQFSEGFNSMELEEGEYVIETGDANDGEVTVTLEIACDPAIFEQWNQKDWRQVCAPFEEAAKDQGFGCEILTNEDGDLPRFIFQLTVY